MPATSPDGLAALVRRRFGYQADGIAGLYTGVDKEGTTAAQDRMLSDYMFAASAREAQAFAELGEPAYVYRFTRLAPGSDQRRSERSISAELAYVFGTQASIDRPWCHRDRALSDQIEQYWTTFAKTGDPNGAGLPEWPRYGRRRRPSWSLEIGPVRCRCWTPNEKHCSTLVWRRVCRTDVRRRRAKGGQAETDIFAISAALIKLSTFQQASTTRRIA